MTKPTPTVIGIDIGASTTKLAAVERGTVDIITNEANFRETPTIVGYGPGERKIGELGSVKMKSNFKNTIVSPNRYIGLKGDNELDKNELTNCPCPTLLDQNEILFKVEVDGEQNKFTPDQVLASFMTHLKTIIQHNNLDDKLIVFSVPSYFTQIEKRAYINASLIAGIKNVKLVSETVALGLDYGSFKKAEMGEGKNVVFVDFGHSQLTTSLINFTSTKMDVMVQLSNRNLGCRNIDSKVFDYMAKKFEEKKGLNVKENKRACLKLMEGIEKQRKILSGISETEIVIESLMEDEDICEVFTRDIMLSESQEILASFKQLLLCFLEQLKKQNIKYDTIELVGGGSRIPRIIEIVQEVFGMSPSRTINSSETIARGATLAAVQESGLFRFHSFNILNRIPYAVKVTGKDGETEINEVIAETGTYVPNERAIKLEIENEVELILVCEDGNFSKEIKKISIQKSEEQKKEVSLTFKFDQDGMMMVKSAKDNEGKDIEFVEESLNTLSDGKIEQFKQKEQEMHFKDTKIIQYYEKKNELESFIYKQKEFLNSDHFKKYAKLDEKESIEKYVNHIAEQLHDEENKMAINDMTNIKQEIEKQIQNLLKTVNERKAEIVLYFKDLENLKGNASETIKQIQNRYRHSKPVVDTCEEIKSIHDWAEEAIKVSKNKEVNELPIVSKKEIDQQNENIQILVNTLINPSKAHYEAPRQSHYEEHYDPSDYHRNNRRNMNNTTYTPRGYQQQRYFPQPGRQRQQETYDPFGMSRSGFFGSNNPFGGFF